MKTLDQLTIIGIFVDDMFKVGPNNHVMNAIAKLYPLKQLGPAETILGMEVAYEPNQIKIHQQSYIINKIQQLGIPINKKIPLLFLQNHYHTPLLNKQIHNSKHYTYNTTAFYDT